jgi:mutator protein MutT
MTSKPFALSVKGLILDRAGQVLVLRRSAQSKNNSGLWDLPGGKCEPGEAMDAALAREVAEETGLHVRLKRLVGTAQVELDDRVVAYLITEAETVGGELRLGSEHDEYEWRAPHKLAERTFPEQFRELVQDYARKAREAKVRVPFHRASYEQQIKTYRAAHPVFERLAKHLTEKLQEVSSALGLHCLVQARAKTIDSFAEKITRPGRVYPDPLRNLSDLCGARVICHTLAGVRAVVGAIEARFKVVPEDSGDKLDNLAANEFGYRSHHFIIEQQLTDLDLKGIRIKKIPAGLLDKLRVLRAEIQVRTILQHAWADIYHELGYKNRFALPFEWRRQFARLAAVVEEADRNFESIGVGLAEYACSYDAYYTDAELDDEMTRLAIVRAADPKPAIAHQLARMAILKGQWKRAVKELTPFEHCGSAALLRDLGISLCKLNGKDPEGSKFQRGQNLLKRAVALDPNDVDAPASLGGTWRKRANAATDTAQKNKYRAEAKAWYQRAFELDPTHPYPVGNYVEYAIADHPDPAEIVNYFRPSLTAASERCRKQAEVGVNLPWAYFDLGKFQLMLHEPYRSLEYYAKGTAGITAASLLDSALGSFAILAEAKLEGWEWCYRFLKLAKAILFAEKDADLPGPTPDTPSLTGPVIIVAGYCGESASPEHRALLKEALRNFRGSIFSGGTEAGISAVVGELQAENGSSLRTIGYVPTGIPAGVAVDGRYKEIRRTAGTGFSPLEPLQYWADLRASKIPIDQVRLLAVGGGRIAASECQMALALGAKVGVVDVAGSEVNRCLATPLWYNHPRLHLLAAEARSMQRFLGQ